MSVSVERLPHSGAIVLSTMDGGYLVSRTYYGYTIKQAKDLFNQYLRGNK